MNPENHRSFERVEVWEVFGSLEIYCEYWKVGVTLRKGEVIDAYGFLRILNRPCIQ